MTVSLIGAAVGLVLGSLQFFVFSQIRPRIGASASANKTARNIWRAVWFDFVILPVIGYYLAPILFPG